VCLDPAGQAASSSLDNWQWRLSGDGITAATSEGWEPRDPSRYIARLKERAPELEDAALVYVREALGAFNARCYLATTVMIGVAVEQVFGRAASAFATTLPAGQATLLRALLDNPATSYNKRVLEFRKRLEPRRTGLPEGTADTLTMDAVADLLRLAARNAAGHPTGGRVDEDTAFTHLQIAGQYLAKMTVLAVYFENRASSGRA
jgi:hypothetical protein